MDLDICLYCEKPIANNSTSFCSNTCRNQESKQEAVLSGGSMIQPDYNMVRSNSLHSLTPTPPPPPNHFYEMAYHRRQSFSYSPVMRRRPSQSTSSSSINSLSSSTLSFDTIKHFHPTIMDDTLSYPVYTSE